MVTIHRGNNVFAVLGTRRGVAGRRNMSRIELTGRPAYQTAAKCTQIGSKPQQRRLQPLHAVSWFRAKDGQPYAVGSAVSPLLRWQRVDLLCLMPEISLVSMHVGNASADTSANAGCETPNERATCMSGYVTKCG